MDRDGGDLEPPAPESILSSRRADECTSDATADRTEIGSRIAVPKLVTSRLATVSNTMIITTARLKPSAIAVMQAPIAMDGAKEGSNPGLETLPLAAAA
jgi:hypothetical protein